MSKFDRTLNLAIRGLIEDMERHSQALMAQERDHPGTVLEPRPCPVCGAVERKETLTNGSFTYVRCAGCTLLYMSPALTEAQVEAGFSDQDPWTRGYWSLMKERIRVQDVTDPGVARRHPVLLDLAPLQSGGRLLDVGCSIGNFLAHARHMYEVEGLEINPDTAQVARERGFQVHACRLEHLERESHYDVITLNQLLYGLRHPLPLVQCAARLLRPGGILYINTPNADSLAMRWYRGRHCHLVGKVNLNVFGPRSLEALAQRTGLEPVAMYTEWLNLYGLDLLVHAFARGAFVHRRNAFLPGYGEACRRDEWLQRRLFGDRFETAGDYVVGIFRKPSRSLP